MEINLSGKTAIVTGAGRGIGEEVAYTLADAGANVVAAARTGTEIEDTIERVESLGVEGLAVPTDLASPADIDALVDVTIGAFGPPEILINNAAANIANDPLEQPSDEVNTMMDVNFRGLFLLSQRIANELLDSDADTGRIINVASVVAHLGVPAMTVYSGTKAGICGLTRGLAAELSKHGITVNSISPGMTRVERIERLMDEKGEIYDLDRIPAARLGMPEEIASACVFLASDHASYITGIDLPVDGGVKITAGLYR